MSNQPPKKRMKSLFSFSKKIDNNQTLRSNIQLSSNSLLPSDIEIKVLERLFVQTGPGLRALICSFSVNKRDCIRI